MDLPSAKDPAIGRFYLLAGLLFLSYLCVAMSLPVVPVFVAQGLGLSNALAGLAVGVVFFSTILSRGAAGSYADRRGAKPALARGLVLYVAGALVSLLAGLLAEPGHGPWPAFATLVAGRLLIGLGESVVGVAVIGWGIGIVGPARAGRVMALVGAAFYGGFAVGGPVGLALYGQLGFAGTMAIGAVLPCLGLAAIAPIPGVAPHAGRERAPFWRVLGTIGPYGAIVCMQGIGFAAIGAFFPLLFIAAGWPHAGFGLTAFGLGFVLVRFLFGHLPDRFGGLAVSTGSLTLVALGQALIWTAAAPGQALAGALFTGLGCSLIFPGLGREVVHRVAPHMRGAALGAFSAFQDLAYGLTGPIAGLLADRAGYRSVFLCGTVAAGIGLAAALRLLCRPPPRATGDAG